MRDEIAQLPNCTCLETITRFHKEPARAAGLWPLDTVRLEIVYSNGREWYGSPGERNLAEGNPAAFIGAGLIANGMFGITLHNVFVSDVATLTPRGADSIYGRRALTYDFRLPRAQLKLQISIPEGNGTVGEEGTFWIDPVTLDLMRMTSRITEIPTYLPLTSAEYTADYARTRFGGFSALLAQQAEMDMQLDSGVEDKDRFDFTHCRSFEIRSELNFDVPEPGAAPLTPSAALIRADATLPALLKVTIRLTTPISDRNAVGEVIEARVAGAVRSKGAIVIDDGAIVRGRIRRLDRNLTKNLFNVGLEFTEVETRSGPARFFADLLDMEKRKGVETTLREFAPQGHAGFQQSEISLPELPGVAAFFILGKSVTLAAGFQTVWRTRGLLRGN